MLQDPVQSFTEHVEYQRGCTKAERQAEICVCLPVPVKEKEPVVQGTDWNLAEGVFNIALLEWGAWASFCDGRDCVIQRLV